MGNACDLPPSSSLTDEHELFLMSWKCRDPCALQIPSEAACEDMGRLSAVVAVRPLLVHSAGRGSCAKSGVNGGDVMLLLVSLGKSAGRYRLVVVEFVGSVSG